MIPFHGDDNSIFSLWSSEIVNSFWRLLLKSISWGDHDAGLSVPGCILQLQAMVIGMDPYGLGRLHRLHNQTSQGTLKATCREVIM